MEGFLKNKHHNIYLNKEYNYKKYICKDCTKKKKEYEYSNSEEYPKDMKNIGYIEISLGRFPIYITTPIMISPFGFNKVNNTISLQFTNLKTDSEMKSFYDLIQELEMNQMSYIGLDESDADLYLSQVRQDKNMKYDPNLIVKVPFIKNSYKVDIRSKDSRYFPSVTGIYNFSKLKCDIYIDKIWKYNGKYICKWKVSKILLL